MCAISTVGKASCGATACDGGKTGLYQRRLSAETLLYRGVQEHLETFLSLADDPTGNRLQGYVEQDFRKYFPVRNPVECWGQGQVSIYSIGGLRQLFSLHVGDSLVDRLESIPTESRNSTNDR